MADPTNTSPPAPTPAQNQDRLKTFFSGHADSTHPNRWDDLWKAGDFLPWDRGYANPALIDLLNTSTFPLDGPHRKRALVPGCGKGYDVVLLAAQGYDAYGLEISENATKAAREWVKDPGEGKEGEYGTKSEAVGRGGVNILFGDFFKDEWRAESDKGEGWDLIYDCTFLCALPPSLRAPWALRMSKLLAPNGSLICLEFPTHKPPKSGGPPWALPSTVYVELFKRPGEEISFDDDGKVIPEEKEESDEALVRVAHFKPERTHAVGVVNGEVKDWVSIWKHKS